MGRIIDIVIVLLIVGWLVGYIGFGQALGTLIHLLLVFAVIAVLLRIINGRRIIK